MKRQILLATILGLVVTCTAWSADAHQHESQAPTNAAFERLKSLAGTWVTVGEDGQEEVASVIRVTAAGSAVHETVFPGQPHEMVSLYTLEGDDIVMTHYCMLGNQPQMRADTSHGTKELRFEFAGGTNLDPAKDPHMHAAVLRFVDDDHIEIDGVAWEDGKPAEEMCGQMKLTRKK